MKKIKLNYAKEAASGKLMQFSTSFGTLADLAVAAEDKGKEVKILKSRTFYREGYDWEKDEVTVEEMDISLEVLDQMVANYQVDLERSIKRPVDYNHAMGLAAFKSNTKDEGAAAGWINQIENRNGELYAFTDFLPDAQDQIREGKYRYVSVTFHPNWLDSITGERVGAKLFGFTLTNNPFVQDLGPVELSNDQDRRSILTFSEFVNNGDNTMQDKLIEMSARLTEKDGEIKELKASLDSKGEQLSAKEAEMVELSAQLEEAKQAIESKGNELVELNNKHEALSKAHDELVADREVAKEENIKLSVQKDLNDGKVFPSEVDSLTKWALSDKEAYEGFIAARGQVVDLGAKGVDDQADVEGESLHEAALRISEQEKISYSAAVDKAMMANGDAYKSHIFGVKGE